MTINHLLEHMTVIEVEPSADCMRAAIQKRLAFAEERCKIESGSLIQVTDSAYQAMADLTKANQGLACEVLKMVLPTAEQLAKTHPYIITDQHIKKLGLTYEALCEYWDTSRGANVVHVKPYEQG